MGYHGEGIISLNGPEAERKRFNHILRKLRTQWADMGPVSYNLSSIRVRHALILLYCFDVFLKTVRLVAVQRTLVPQLPNFRIIVKETYLFCHHCLDFIQRIVLEWHQEVLFYVLSTHSNSMACVPWLCGLGACFIAWQQWLLHNEGSGNNPPVLKSSFRPEMESLSDGTVCVVLDWLLCAHL